LCYLAIYQVLTPLVNPLNDLNLWLVLHNFSKNDIKNRSKLKRIKYHM